MNRRDGWLIAALAAALNFGGIAAQCAAQHPSGSHARQATPSAQTHAPRRPSLLDALRSLGGGGGGGSDRPAAGRSAPSDAPMDDWSHLSHSPHPGRSASSRPAGERRTPRGVPRPIDEQHLERLRGEEEPEEVRLAPEPSASEPDEPKPPRSSRRRTARRSAAEPDRDDAGSATDNDRRSSPAAPRTEAPSVAPRTAEPTVPRVARRPLPSSADDASSDAATRSSEESSPSADPAPSGASSRRRTRSTSRPAVPSLRGAAGSAARGPASDADGEDTQPAPRKMTAPTRGGSDRDVSTFETRGSVTQRTSPSAPPAASASPTTPAARVRTVASEIPAVRVTTEGPGQIPINKPAEYEILVENRGAIDAPGLLVRATLPSWGDVRGHQASRGEIEVQPSNAGRHILWEIDRLPAGGKETLSLRIAAERAEQFDMKVEWTLVPQTNVATVSVQEPKLELVIEGPDSVIYGDSEVYRVRVLNPGNGTASDVAFTLSPNSATPQTQRLGEIPPGKEAQFEVELTAQDRGTLEIHGLVTGEGDLRTESLKKIRVASADLVATLDGPQMKYQGSEGRYRLVLTNSGETDSRDIVAAIQLPQGVEYVDGIAGAEASAGELRWQLDGLAPGESETYEFRCRMGATGSHVLAFQCRGSAAGGARVSVATEVESLADLKLSVNDPAAPAPVGEEVVYDVVVQNRGSKAATDVKAIAQFSNGIEPVRVEGQPAELLPGQVVFESIDRIEAGQKVTLRVVARADEAGVHRFRTEVSAEDDTLLVAEEATRYITLSSERVSRRSGDDESSSR